MNSIDELPPLIQVEGSYHGTTNITSLSLFYSLHRAKFIRGRFEGDRVAGKILYRLLPGRYVQFNYLSWWKKDPPEEITLTLISLSEEGQEALESATIKFRHASFIDRPEIPQQVRVFFAARPGYHSYPGPDFERVFTEEENTALLRFIQQEKTLLEGEEVE